MHSREPEVCLGISVSSSSMSSASPVVSFGRLATKELLNSMSRIMDAGEESTDADHVNACADVKLTCRDGVVMWNRFCPPKLRMLTRTFLTATIVFLIRFLLAANCPLLSECFSAHAEDDSDASAVIILPDVSCSTLSSMLKCTLNYAVRWDTLSVNEQQVMALLGFNMEKAPATADADAPDYDSEIKRPPRMDVEIVQEEEDEEDGDSVDGSNAREDFVAISDDESGDARSSAEAGHNAEAAADAFGDIPIRSGDIKGDVDTISMMSVEGGNLLFQNGAAAKRCEMRSQSSSELSIPGLADVPAKVDKSVGTDDLDGIRGIEEGKTEKQPGKHCPVFNCNEPGCDIEFSRRQHLEQHVALHTKSEEFPCDLCKKVFYHEMSLKKHRVLHENADVVLKCAECGEGVRRGKRGLRIGIPKIYSSPKHTTQNILFLPLGKPCIYYPFIVVSYYHSLWFPPSTL